jgi:hypothetical protein
MTAATQTAPGHAARATAAPVAPVMSETLPDDMADINAGAPVATTPDGPASAAPVYGSGMTDDPITWNLPHTAATGTPRAPQNILPTQPVPAPAQAMMKAMPVPAATTPMVYTAPAPAMPTASAPASYNSNYQVAEGFGRDLPLVMALRQIVPPQYGFVFDQGIDISGQVSWQGGKPWDIVLQQTLAPLGLQGMINGNVVTITRAGQPMYQPAAANAGAQVMTQVVQTSTTVPMAANAVAMPASMTSAPMAPIVDAGSPGTPVGYTPVNVSNLAASSTWTAPRNSTLRNILEDWAEYAGVELYWASEYDYPIQSSVSVDGTFEEAVQVLLKGLSESKPRPMGRLHPNLPNGPAVLVIETRQNSL